VALAVINNQHVRLLTSCFQTKRLLPARWFDDRGDFVLMEIVFEKKNPGLNFLMNFFDSAIVFGIVDRTKAMVMKKQILITCLSALLASGMLPASAADKKPTIDASKLPPVSDKTGVTYAADIKPIFEKSCIKCHGEQRQKGKLRLDSLAAVLKGGQDGKVVEAGKSAESMLVQNIAHVGDEDMFMPPPDNKDKIPQLSKEQVGLIRAWIDQGAK